MKIKTVILTKIDEYDLQKSQKLLSHWVDIMTNAGWACTEWRIDSYHEVAVKLEHELEKEESTEHAPTIIGAEEIFGQHTDTAGNFHWCGTHSGEHKIKAEEDDECT